MAIRDPAPDTAPLIVDPLGRTREIGLVDRICRTDLVDQTRRSDPVDRSSAIAATPAGPERRPLTPAPGAPADEYEYRPLKLDSSISRASAATMLALRAEFAGWELARVLGFPDGTRRVWLRRRRSAGLLPGLTP